MSDNYALCMGCMHPLEATQTRCGFCGCAVQTDNAPDELPCGTVLSERYLVGRTLERLGDAAVYMGYDQVLKAPIYIREYNPSALCTRAERELIPLEGQERPFALYLEAFRAQARTLARLRDLPAAIPIYDIFDAHGTAYTVSEFIEGETLAQLLSRAGGRLSWEDTRPLLMPLLGSVIQLHAAGVRHLGLCPRHLLLASDGKLRLAGFALPDARRLGSPLAADLPAGYAAPEQYAVGAADTADAAVGESADVYALCAILFHMLTGAPPQEASARARGKGDLLVPKSVADTLPPHVAGTLLGGLQVKADARIPSVSALRDRLSASPKVAEIGTQPEPSPAASQVAVKIEPMDDTADDSRRPRRSHRKLYTALIILFFVALLVGLATVLLLSLNPHLLDPKTPAPTGPTTTAATIETAAPTSAPTGASPDMATVTNLVGKAYYTDVKGKSFGGRAVQLGGLVYSSRPFGEVVRQEPSGGANAPMGDPIVVYISLGTEESLAVPNVAGWREAQARLYLEALGFEVEVLRMPLSPQERGLVDSTDPAPGTMRPRGGKLILRVSDREPDAVSND